MKETFGTLAVSLLLMTLFGCSANDSFSVKDQANSYPPYIEQYGQELAEEFSQTVSNLHEMGIFYSDAGNTPEFMEQFFKDWYMASPSKTKSNTAIEYNEFFYPEKILNDYFNMTDIQKDFFDRIVSECENSSSIADLEKRLLTINEDIYRLVPKIQQERLFIVSASLYYLSGEVEQIKRSGQMFVNPVWNMPKIKTRSESGSFGDNCRSFFSSVALTVGSIIGSGAGQEIIKSITKAAGAVGWIIVACSLVTGDTSYKDYCSDKYEACINSGSWMAQIGSGSGNSTMCYDCYRYCLGQYGDWDCPRPN